jgi:hypothetical protein
MMGRVLFGILNSSVQISDSLDDEAPLAIIFQVLEFLGFKV